MKCPAQSEKARRWAEGGEQGVEGRQVTTGGAGWRWGVARGGGIGQVSRDSMLNEFISFAYRCDKKRSGWPWERELTKMATHSHTQRANNQISFICCYWKSVSGLNSGFWISAHFYFFLSFSPSLPSSLPLSFPFHVDLFISFYHAGKKRERKRERRGGDVTFSTANVPFYTRQKWFERNIQNESIKETTWIWRKSRGKRERIKDRKKKMYPNKRKKREISLHCLNISN